MTLILFYSLLWHTAEWCTIAFSYTHMFVICYFGMLVALSKWKQEVFLSSLSGQVKYLKVHTRSQSMSVIERYLRISIDWLSLVYISRATSHKFTPWPSNILDIAHQSRYTDQKSPKSVVGASGRWEGYPWAYAWNPELCQDIPRYIWANCAWPVPLIRWRDIYLCLVFIRDQRTKAVTRTRNRDCRGLCMLP